MVRNSPHAYPCLGPPPPRVTRVIQPSSKWLWRYRGSLENGCHAEAESVGSGLQAEGRGGIDTSPEHQGLNSFGNEKGFVKAWRFINNSLNWGELPACQLTSISWEPSVGGPKEVWRSRQCGWGDRPQTYKDYWQYKAIPSTKGCKQLEKYKIVRRLDVT